MKSLINVFRQLKGNKSGIEGGGFGFIVKIAITLVIGGLFFWMVAKAMGV